MVLSSRWVCEKQEMPGGKAMQSKETACMQSKDAAADNAMHAPRPTRRRSMRLKDTSAGMQPPEGTSQKGKKGSDHKIENDAWAINPVLKTLLLGTACLSSPLRHLSVRMELEISTFDSSSSIFFRFPFCQ